MGRCCSVKKNSEKGEDMVFRVAVLPSGLIGEYADFPQKASPREPLINFRIRLFRRAGTPGLPLDRGVPPARRQALGARPAKRARQERRSAVPRVRNGSPRIPCTTAPCKPAIARRRPPASPCLFGHGNGIEENFRYITVADDEGSEFPLQGWIIARISAKSRISGIGRELSDGRSRGSVIYREKLRIHYRSSTSYPILQGRMPASRALPEPGEPPTAGARSLRRTPSRSEAKRAAEDGRIGDTARSGERHSMERRTTLADARRPPASARPSVGGGLLRQTGMAIPAAHAPLAAAAQPLWRRLGRRGLRPPSLL